MRRRRAVTLAASFFVLATVALLYQMTLGGWYHNSAMVLLIEDSMKEDDARVRVWLDAAKEEGLLMRVAHDSEFLRPWFPRSAYAGLILPDQAHRSASDSLAQAITQYAEAGGRVLLAYDAGTLTARGAYAKGRSRFSALAGVDYALYDALADATIRWDAVLGQPELLDDLQLPPGKYAPAGEAAASESDPPAHDPNAQIITGYRAPAIRYPAFVTRGAYNGRVLLRSLSDTIVAGERDAGRGRVLFVNLPLGYLKGRTDGALLHGFLRYYADTMLGVPRLAPVPDGIGGLVINWHLDSNAALSDIENLAPLGFYRHGPYSIHVTAGPDAREKGDGLGIDVPGNLTVREWLQSMAKQHAIGSHGGWIHDYFSRNLPQEKNAEFERYLALNKQVLEDVIGRPVLEYSAPEGYQPEWVTQWLEEHGILAYYFTGNAGMGPTRSYRDGELRNRRIWSFPIPTYRTAAGFEEMKEAGVPRDAVADWLQEMVDFAMRKRVARLVYFHPTGIAAYAEAVRAWLVHIEVAQSTGQFALYTMSDLARFLNRREQVAWSVRSYLNGVQYVRATHPENLVSQTWLLPRESYERPAVDDGEAKIVEDIKYWVVVAGEGRRLQFHVAQRNSIGTQDDAPERSDAVRDH